jgi:hypothetical protein
MKYTAVESRNTPGEWRVEFIDDNGEGEVEVTLFSGKNAESRAKEYAVWKNRQVLGLAPDIGRAS